MNKNMEILGTYRHRANTCYCKFANNNPILNKNKFLHIINIKENIEMDFLYREIHNNSTDES